MDFNLFGGIATLGSGVLYYIVPFIFVLTIVVFFHEFGHFIVARWAGVKVLAFSIGFGPQLFGFNDRHGTRWKISAIPLGGYVKFFGDENAASVPDTEAVARMNASDREQSFFHKPVGKRAAVVVAGPLANFILAIVIFASVFSIYGKQMILPRVDAVQVGSAAETAGIKSGDVILSINGDKIGDFTDMQRIVSASAGETLTLGIERGGQALTLKATPQMREVKDNFGGLHRMGMLGISRSTAKGDVKYERVNPLAAVGMGVKETWFIVDRTLSYLGGVVSGRENADQLGGPIRIAQVSGEVASAGGLLGLFHLAAVLSVSIGLLNLFPIPLLDGGHLLFYGIEAARGRPLSDRAQEYGFRVGLAIVLMLMIFATFNDVVHIWKS